MYQVLARKWRPKNFKELVGQEHVAQALTYALDHQKIHHAYLFTGTRGVGKTTIARIYAKSLNCLTNGVSSNPCGVCANCQEIDQGIFPDLIEIDAASRRGIDETRSLLDNVPYAPSKGRYKVYLIDEVHMFTRESFNALLKTLEEPPEHVKFILATTDPQKMPATVLSRCLQFYLKNIQVSQITDHLAYVLENEKIPFDRQALTLIAEAGDGSMRDSLSLLDQAIAFGMGKISTDDVAKLLGATPIWQIHHLYQCIIEENPVKMRECLLEIQQYSPDYVALFKGFLSVMQELTICQLQAQHAKDDIAQSVVEMAGQISVETTQLWYQIATETWLTFVSQPDLHRAFEMMLLRMLALKPFLMDDSVELAQVNVKVSDNPQENHPAAINQDEMIAVSDSPEMDIEKLSTDQHMLDVAIESEVVVDGGFNSSVEKEIVKKKIDLVDCVNQVEAWGEFLLTVKFDNVMLEEFMRHTCPISYTQNKLTLTVSEESSLSLLEEMKTQIATHIGQQINKEINVDFILDADAMSPKRDDQEKTTKLQSDLKSKFESLPIVQAFYTQLNARIIEDRIKLLEDKE